MRFCSDILGLPALKPANFGNTSDFPLVPTAGQSFHLSYEISQHKLHGLEHNFIESFMATRS